MNEKTLPLEQEFNYYKENFNAFVKKYANKYIVLKGKKFLGSYDDKTTAIIETRKHHKPGTFMVKLCSDDPLVNRAYCSSHISV